MKIQGTNRSGEGGRRACYDVSPDLGYDWEGEKRRATTINGLSKESKKDENNNKKPLLYILWVPRLQRRQYNTPE